MTINKWVNELETYEVRNENGKVIEKFRTKATAIYMLPKLIKVYGKHLEIIKVK